MTRNQDIAALATPVVSTTLASREACAGTTGKEPDDAPRLPADKYGLYTAAFQEPEAEIALLWEMYRQRCGNSPVSLREDFCGSAAVAIAWVRSDPRATAIAVDNDCEPLAYAAAQHHSLNEMDRLRLIHGDVQSTSTARVDVLCAMNGSFCVFKSRPALVRYLARCRDTLNHNGLLVVNVYCGPDAYRTGTDRIELPKCTCIWEQAEFDPATNYALNHVHFRFADGSRIDQAFSYDWRLWTPAELVDAVAEAGFTDSRVLLGRDRATLLDGRAAASRRESEDWLEAYILAWP